MDRLLALDFVVQVAPVGWVPDHMVSACSSCHTPFSFVFRRHHCRRCGGIFCNSCSGHRLPCRGFSSPVRVCNSCALASSESITNPTANLVLFLSKNSVSSLSQNDCQQLATFVLGGIPPEVRSKVWLFLASGNNIARPDYEKLCNQLSDCKDTEPITMDIDRTLQFFASQGTPPSSLQGEVAIRVLQALCVELPSLGYHQQFAYLVCHTLCHLPEADAFWVVHQILMYYGMSTLFYDNAKNVSILVDHAIQVFRQYLPQLAAHMHKHHISLEGVLVRWFSTLFCADVPGELCARIWDLFLLQGRPVLVRVALSLLHLVQDDLLASDTASTMSKIVNMGGYLSEVANTLISELVPLATGFYSCVVFPSNL
ncbi:rab GTPase-activating protein 1 [Pelomyxa schiedti]|nr:rab GTPase-activating protein 1 [Pelomyxa schiedti]